jgi:thiamine-phosphate pyrophosphorylase
MAPDDPRLSLLAVTDDLRDGIDGLLSRTTQAVRGGVSMVVLRLKHADARMMAEVGRALLGHVSVPLLVSERADVALAIGAAGVHLRSGSLPPAALRPHVPSGFLIGTAASTEVDVRLAQQGDFVMIGPVFGAGGIGVTRFAALAAACGCPAVAIGGIDAETGQAVRGAGAAGVAALRGILGAADVAVAAAALAARRGPMG